MTIKHIGGFAKPIQLSLFIRDFLADGRETWAQNLYAAYKQAVQAIPSKKKAAGKRRVISYAGFRTYLYKARKIGLIEYVTLPDGSLKTDTAVDKAGNFAPYLAKAIFFQAVLSRINDPAWSNLQEAAGYQT